MQQFVIYCIALIFKSMMIYLTYLNVIVYKYSTSFAHVNLNGVIHTVALFIESHFTAQTFKAQLKQGVKN